MKCTTRKKNILNHVYFNIKQAYRTLPQSHASQSDHLSLYLKPAYTPCRIQTNPIRKLISVWVGNTVSQLQDCSIKREWSVFENQDLEEYTHAALGYISFYTENVLRNEWNELRTWKLAKILGPDSVLGKVMHWYVQLS